MHPVQRGEATCTLKWQGLHSSNFIHRKRTQ